MEVTGCSEKFSRTDTKLHGVTSQKRCMSENVSITTCHLKTAVQSRNTAHITA